MRSSSSFREIMPWKFQRCAVVCLSSLFLFSGIPQSFSQSSNPQNIRTFYSVQSPPLSTPNSPPRPGKSPTKAAVGRAVGVTAASTLVLFWIVFFLLQRRSRQKKQKQRQSFVNSHGASPFVPQTESFKRLNGKFKALIVDENGLDVLYWNDLERAQSRTSFKKHYCTNSKEEDDRKMVQVQEVPLLVGMSSTSQDPLWAERDHQTITNAPLAPPPSPQPSSGFAAPVQAVPKGIVAPTPPPPPKAGVSALPLKPPPPVGKRKDDNTRLSSLGDAASSGSGQMKLKPLHWDKVNPNLEHSMVWDNIEKGSFRFDGDMMEALFGYVATNRKTPGVAMASEGEAFSSSQIFILNTRKSQNTAIVLKSLGVTRKEITDALLDGHGLNADALEKLIRIAPTDEEESEIAAFDGDPARLADAESFLYHLLKVVPSSFRRFKALLFRLNYGSEISHLKDSLQSLASACEELRTGGLFLKLLEAVLKAGNRLNAGTSRGNAQAFNLSALRKLSDVKSTDGKTTLLQFVVQEVVRAEGRRFVLNRYHSYGSSISSHSGNHSSYSSSSEDEKEWEYITLGLPVIGGLSTEFSSVRKAASTDYNLLLKTGSDLAAQTTEIKKLLANCERDGGFGREMKAFLETAEVELRELSEQQTKILELVKKTTQYYQAGSSCERGVHPLQLFVIVKDFLGLIDQVCMDIARNMQRRQSSSSSSSSLPARVFKFPKLPTDFMSDNLRSTSDDSSYYSSEVKF